jgi:iron complex transport system permease protein
VKAQALSVQTSAIVLAPGARLRLLLAGSTLGALALFLFSFTVGPYPIPVSTVLSVFLHRLALVDKTWTDAVEAVVMGIRGPRIVAALLVGAALAVAGATYQNLFRNPLVSPAVLGVSAGSGFGAALGIILGLPGYGIQGMAFLCGLAAVTLALGLGRWLDRNGLLVLVLAGMVVSAFFQALISLLKVVADPLNQLPTITFWLLGGLHRISAGTLVAALWPIGAAAIVLYALRWQVNALAAGEDEARSLGVDVPRVRLLLILAATLMTAACVSIAGIVGWVGLLIPHIVRMLVGPSFPAVLPMCAVTGGAFLLLVDDIARAPGTSEIPLGILTALIGAPFFALALARTRQAWF